MGKGIDQLLSGRYMDKIVMWISDLEQGETVGEKEIRELFAAVKSEGDILTTQENLIRAIGDIMTGIWPDLNKLRKAATHVLKTDKEIEKTEKILNNTNMTASERRHKTMEIAEKIREESEKSKADKDECARLAGAIEGKMNELAKLLMQLKGKEGPAKDLANGIIKALTKSGGLKTELEKISGAWNKQFKFEQIEAKLIK